MYRAWTTRAETEPDIGLIREINLAAFETSEEADLVDALRTDPAWIDGLSMVATGHDGTPVGHALLTRCHIGDVPALCLAPCAVLPQHQRTGAGAAAIRACLQEAQRRDERFVTVLGHPSYYPKFGFTRAAEHGIRVPIDVPDEALMALTLRRGEPLPAGTIRYAGPFGI